MTAVLRRAFVAAAIVWAALLVVAPFLASRTHATALGSAVVLAVYAIGSMICHQLPERSYRLWAAQMPVCARCAGIYVGAAVAAVAGARRKSSARFRSPERLALHRSVAARSPGRLALRHSLAARLPGRLALRSPQMLALQFVRGGALGKRRKEREPFRRAAARALLAFAVAPTALTLVFEWTTGITPSNTIRFAAGVPIGVVVAWLVVSAARDQVN